MTGRLVLVLLLAAGSVGALEYVESSDGLQTPALEEGPTELEVADVNGDGHPDIVSIGDHGSPYVNSQEHGVMVWLGDGQGHWSVLQSGNFGYGGVALGDVNGDGLVDVAYGMHHNDSGDDFGDQLLEAALGDGTGAGWIPWDDGLASSGETWGMFGTDLADVDADGDLDVGSVSFGCCAGVHVYLSAGDGTWTQSWGFLGGNSDLLFVFGEVDGDGIPDIAVAHEYGTVYLGDGTGGFQSADAGLPPAGSLGRSGLDLGDVDADGRDELAFVNGSGGIEVWRYDPGPGLWEDLSGNLPASGPYQATQIWDMDGDGWGDLCAFGNGQVTVWLSDGEGNWSEAVSFQVPNQGDCQAFRVRGDTDHNGFADILLVDEEGSWYDYRNHLRLYRETSEPTDLQVRWDRPRGGETLLLGTVAFLRWSCAVPGPDPGSVRVELSLEGPSGPWLPVADGEPNDGLFQWVVTAPQPSLSARLRLRVVAGGDTAWATSGPLRLLPASASAVAPSLQARQRHALRVWPQPARSFFMMDLTGVPQGPIRWELLDSSGRRLRSGSGRVGPLRVDLGGLASGVYWLRVRRGGRSLGARVLRLR
jgi:hypothetical protein